MSGSSNQILTAKYYRKECLVIYSSAACVKNADLVSPSPFVKLSIFEGGGIISSSMSRPSICVRMASSALMIASWIVDPAEKHPGRSGTVTP
jgi:hypothetical protein